MKENEPYHDEALRKLLKEWRTDASLPARFQETVWRRIERAEHSRRTALPSVWTTIGHWIGTVLPRPALATSYVAVLLALGVTAVWAHARRETTHLKDELGQRYIRALDPYLAPRQ
jgi:anti-sigma-K factor RskA